MDTQQLPYSEALAHQLDLYRPNNLRPTDPKVAARAKFASSNFPSLTGYMLFATGFLVLGSAFRGSRLEIGGLLVHPYMLPIGLAAPFMLVYRLKAIPARITAGLVVFVTTFAISCMGGDAAVREAVKLFTVPFVIIVIALLVRRRGDFIAGVLGLVLALAILGTRGLQAEDSGEGINPMDIGNKNVYSMYALPAVLAAGFIVLQVPLKSWAVKGTLAGSSLIVLLAIFLSGNRSGWLGGLVVAAMLLFKFRNARTLLFVAFIGGGIAYVMTNYANTDVAKRRFEQTESGTKSDQLRIALVQESIKIAFENPLVGVSPQRLNFELGRALSNRFGANWIDPHNVFAYIMAGSGLICFSALLYTGWALAYFRSVTSKLEKRDPFVLARGLMRMMLILWVVRGMFSREILYSPGFCIGIGLALGLCIVEYSIAEAKSLPTRLQPS